jgi:hypothetical protein
LFYDDLLYFLCNGHESSKLGFKVIDSSIPAECDRWSCIRTRRTSRYTLVVTWRVLVPLLAGISIVAQSTADHQAVFANLGKEADLFERSAYRVSGRERLIQTVPDGVRIGRGVRGIETRLPGFTREIVSQYGFVSLDEPGGTIREVRRVLTIDGQRWNKRTKSLSALAQDIAANDDKGKQRQLERFEEHGLHGFVSDLGQLILLFARGGTSRYELRYDSTDDRGLWVYTFQQLDGKEALTIYGEGKEPTRQMMKGRIWITPPTKTPVQISLESEREIEKVLIRDTSTVEYAKSSLGFLLPSRIVHQQFVGPTLYVTDTFEYSDFRQVLRGGRP